MSDPKIPAEVTKAVVDTVKFVVDNKEAIKVTVEEKTKDLMRNAKESMGPNTK